jgi:hypothetical protein
MPSFADYSVMRLPKEVSYVFFSLVIALASVYISYQIWSSSNTQPTPFLEEGFAGPVAGTSEISCGEKSVEAVKLYTMFLNKISSTETGSDDLNELKNLLGKLCCLKQDLLSAGSLVNATKNNPYITSQDIEPVSETVARCFAKTVPKRDLDIILNKWSTRGDMLISRLCTSYDLEPAQTKDAKTLFTALVADITDILMTVCLKGPVTIAGDEGPRMIEGRQEPGLLNMGEYNGYY